MQNRTPKSTGRGVNLESTEDKTDIRILAIKCIVMHDTVMGLF